MLWRRQWHPTAVLLPGKSHGHRSLVGCSPGGLKESDTTERLHFHFSLSRIGEGNGNPLQFSWLENPRDGEPGGLPSRGSHRVGHDWSDLAAAAGWSAKEFRFGLTEFWTHAEMFFQKIMLGSHLDVGETNKHIAVILSSRRWWELILSSCEDEDTLD